MAEFKATHRYLGGDGGQYSFEPGDLAVRIGKDVSCPEKEGRTISIYKPWRIDYADQLVYDDCMEEL